MTAKNWFITTVLVMGVVMTVAVFQAQAAGEAQVIAIKADKFHYSPSTITLKKDHPVTLQFTSEDVVHGFLVKPLKLETNIVPGKTTELTFTPQVAGTFRAMCDRYCGPGHSDMHMTVVVTE